MVDGAHGKKAVICSKDVSVCKQHLQRREKGEVGSPGFYQGYPKKNAADPFKSPGGLLCTSFYSLEEGDGIRARDEEQMGKDLQQDSSESDLDQEPIDEDPVIITTPNLVQARNSALKTRNKVTGIAPLSIDPSVKPVTLGFTRLDGQKTLENFSGGRGRQGSRYSHEKATF